MNYRERFLSVMRFETPDRVPNHELGLWGQTFDRWLSEGMPQDAIRNDFFRGEDFFKLDRREFVPLNVWMIPGFETQVIEEDERVIVYRDGSGILRRALKEGTVRGTRLSMDQYIDFPVKGEADFEAMKRRYDPAAPERYPADWDAKVAAWKKRDCPLCLLTNGSFGLYSMMRTWVGTENLSYAFYDQPKLLEAMLEFLTEFFIRVTDRAVEQLDIDYFNFFEDFAGKGGPLISPRIFRQFFMPRYRRIIEHLTKHGIRFIILDSDGNIEALLPLFVETGITGIWPLEIAADMDPVRLRKQYGRAFTLFGGIDKRELARDRASIRRELLSKVPWLIEQGGYIPTIDHAIPPDISYDNFRYYLELKLKLLEGKSI